MELYYRAKFRLSYLIKTFLTKRKKIHYQCGKIEAPYFKEGELCAPIARIKEKDYDYYYENFVKEENE